MVTITKDMRDQIIKMILTEKANANKMNMSNKRAWELVVKRWREGISY